MHIASLTHIRRLKRSRLRPSALAVSVAAQLYAFRFLNKRGVTLVAEEVGDRRLEVDAESDSAMTLVVSELFERMIVSDALPLSRFFLLACVGGNQES